MELIYKYSTEKYSWELFYNTESPALTTSTSRVNGASSYSYYLKCCLFDKLSDPSYGAAFYMKSTSDNSKILIEDISISECSVSSDAGGGIYFATQGQIVIYKVCGNKCKTCSNGYGEFSYTFTSEATSSLIQLNSVFLTSAINCGSYTATSYSQIRSERRYSNIRCWYGNQTINAVNSSNNACYEASFIFVGGSSSENSYVTNQIK